MIEIPKTNIRQLRMNKGLTQKQLSKFSGVSRGYIGLLESNKRENTTLNTLEIILNSLCICCKDFHMCDNDCCNNHTYKIVLRFNLKTIRLRKKISQRQLANLSGVSRSYINLLESKKRKNPTLTTLRLLANALDVNLKELIVLKPKTFLRLNLKNIRLREKISQKELAKLSGISRNYINSLENKKRKSPNILTLRLLSTALGVSLEEIALPKCKNCKKLK